ncbi:MAG TPA: choice-of-anchor Q domain-containing protein, partial [Chitinophagaceae bacterium]|nr:choice-of-anchor Q domain-containing protein [Chitinophagaceae bacterium]
YPAAWPGIYFRADSKSNVLNYAVIKNSYQSIAAEGLAAGGPKVTLNQCVIDNSYDAGIIALNSSIKATNCLISNCGKNIAIGKGGDYEFTHCTVASYFTRFLEHNNPVVTLSDVNGTTPATLNALFRNCILWGESEVFDNEVVVEKTSSNGSVTFDQVLWRMKTIPANITVTPSPINQVPQFDSIDVSKNYWDFRLNTGNSPAVDSGKDLGITIDLDGNIRPVGTKPDLGCFEKQ